MSLPVRRPATLPIAMAATTRASQRATARPGWVALHRASRTVTGRGAGAGGGGGVDTGVPFAGRFVDVVHARPDRSDSQGRCAPGDGGVFSTTRCPPVSQDGAVLDGFRSRFD